MLFKNKKIAQIFLIFALMQLLCSCQLISGQGFKKIILYIGKTVIDSASGKVVETILDQVFNKISNISNNPSDYSIQGYVIPDSSNSLEGKYSTTLHLEGLNNSSRQKIKLDIDEPKMFRESQKAEEWHLYPDLRELVTQIFEKKLDELDEQGNKGNPANDTYGSVIPNSSRSLKGKYSSVFKIKGYFKNSNKKIILRINKPRMIRETKESDNWELAPELKQIIEQVINVESYQEL